jgi:uncharacterized membrane protein YeaQ/YmgE (transglycosylase-associated protein family)
MTILGWILLGLIAGFIGSKVVSGEGQGCLMNIALGLVGAIVGGGLFSLIDGKSDVTAFNEFSLLSILLATVGAIIVLVVYHAIMGRRALK